MQTRGLIFQYSQGNSKRVKYEYKLNDQVLLDKGISQRKLNPKTDRPYQVVQIYISTAPLRYTVRGSK
jgi:hypothetical protein